MAGDPADEAADADAAVVATTAAAAIAAEIATTETETSLQNKIKEKENRSQNERTEGDRMRKGAEVAVLVEEPSGRESSTVVRRGPPLEEFLSRRRGGRQRRDRYQDQYDSRPQEEEVDIIYILYIIFGDEFLEGSP